MLPIVRWTSDEGRCADLSLVTVVEVYVVRSVQIRKEVNLIAGLDLGTSTNLDFGYTQSSIYRKQGTCIHGDSDGADAT
jgi:hypothetical protein